MSVLMTALFFVVLKIGDFLEKDKAKTLLYVRIVAYALQSYETFTTGQNKNRLLTEKKATDNLFEYALKLEAYA